MTSQSDNAGCQDLLEVVEKIKPVLHIFGHIHEGYGITTKENSAFINASSCDLIYQLKK